jgi:predicted Zn-dependent protease
MRARVFPWCLSILFVALFTSFSLAQSAASAPVTLPAGPTPSAVTDLKQLRQMIDRGHAKDALDQLNHMATQQPEPEGVERLRGLAFYAQSDLPEADRAFAAALLQDKKDAESAQMRGLTLFRLGKPGDAIPLLESATEWTAQTKADPNYVLALCYLDTRRYDDARHAFASQYGFPPDSASAYLLAGRMLFRREYLPAAEESVKKAVELDPQLPLAHLLIGEIELAGQHLDVAIDEFEKERARNPLYGGIYDRLGDAYSRAGKYQQAEQSLQRALLLEPTSTGPYILLGKVLIKLQDPTSAASYLERAAKMDGSNYMTHNLLGQAYRAMGRIDEGKREVEIAQKLQAAQAPHLEGVH